MAERRARLQGKLKRLAACQAELAREIEVLAARLEGLRAEEQQYAAVALSLHSQLAATDGKIVDYDCRLRPERIESINGWAGRFGKRGALIAAIKELIESAYPEPVAALYLLEQVTKRFDLVFKSRDERKRWYGTTLRKRLAELRDAGVIARVPGPKIRNRAATYWVWTPDEGPSLADLREQAAALERSDDAEHKKGHRRAS